MRGNIEKQLSSIALLVLLLVAVAVPVMATDSGEGTTDTAGDYVPADGYVGADDISNASAVDDSLALNASGDDAGDIAILATDENVSDGEPVDGSMDAPAAEDGVYYATAYGNNCQYTPAQSACTEQQPVSSPCPAATNSSTTKAACKCTKKASSACV